VTATALAREDVIEVARQAGALHARHLHGWLLGERLGRETSGFALGLSLLRFGLGALLHGLALARAWLAFAAGTYANDDCDERARRELLSRGVPHLYVAVAT
jgi:hypothetical protein